MSLQFKAVNLETYSSKSCVDTANFFENEWNRAVKLPEKCRTERKRAASREQRCCDSPNAWEKREPHWEDLTEFTNDFTSKIWYHALPPMDIQMKTNRIYSQEKESACRLVTGTIMVQMSEPLSPKKGFPPPMIKNNKGRTKSI